MVVALTIVGPSIGRGASSGTTVSATVPSATSLSTTNCADGQSGRTALTVAPAASVVGSFDCEVVFGSSNDTAMLRTHQLDRYGSAMWMATTGGLDTDGGDGRHFDTDGIATHALAGDDRAYSIAQQSTGQVVVVGSHDPGGVDDDHLVVRFTVAGAVDSGFGGGTGRRIIAVDAANDDRLHDVAIDPRDDAIVAVGRVDVTGTGVYDLTAVRMLADGTLDPAFGGGDGVVSFDMSAGGSDEANAVDVTANGSIVIVGQAAGDGLVMRLTATGALDSTFNGSGSRTLDVASSTDRLFDVDVLGDGSIVAAGMGTSTSRDVLVAKFTSAGALDTAFAGGAGFATADASAAATHDRAKGLAIDATGRIVVAGYVEGSVAADRNSTFVRFSAAGALDTAFGTSGIATVPVLAAAEDVLEHAMVQRDGRIVGVGYNDAGSGQDPTVIRLTSAGQLDATFDGDGIWAPTPAGIGELRDALVGVDGKLTAVGEDDGSTNDFLAVRFETTQIADFVGGTADWVTGTNVFGACLRSVTGGASTDAGSWTADTVDADCADGNTDPWRGVPATAEKVAVSAASGTTTAQANLRFGMRAGSSQAPGSYFAPVAFEVVAPMA